MALLGALLEKLARAIVASSLPSQPKALAARHRDLEQDDPQTETELLPRPRDTTVTGLYYLLPIFVLVWNILLDRLSPSFSTYLATPTMIASVFTQHPLKALFRD